MKELICREFCAGLSVSELPNGYAISTAYNAPNGDPLGFYVIGPDDHGLFRVFEPGSLMPFLEASGASLEGATREEAFSALLHEYGATYESDSGEISLTHLDKEELPRATLDFLALLLRVQDLLLLTRERVESTFREDVVAALQERLKGRAIITEREPVSPELTEEVPDLVMKAPERDPVALFIATSDKRVYQAMQLQMIAQYEAHLRVVVTAILDTEAAISQSLRQKADNRLDAMPRYRGEEKQAIQRIVREVIGGNITIQ
jgi:hypothetical protein